MLSNKTLKHNKYQLITWHLNVKKVFIVLSGKSFQTTLKNYTSETITMVTLIKKLVSNNPWNVVREFIANSPYLMLSDNFFHMILT